MKLAEYKEKVYLPLRQVTLCFLIRGEEVLLAMKKRGFGKDRWNGVGGKPNNGESLEQAAVREAQEEINVIPKNLNKAAIIDFYFPHHPDWNQQIVVYLSDAFEGIPEESEEMKPEWFNKKDLPLDEMWPADRVWLPKILEGKIIKGEVLFGENDTVLDTNFSEN